MRLASWSLALPLLASAAIRRPTGTAKLALRELQHRLDAEGEADKASYNGLACWCRGLLEEEQRAADNVRQDLTQLSHGVEAQGARNEQLALQLQRSEAELEGDLRSLATAKALRQKDAESFGGDEQAHVQSINDLDGALQALNRGRPAAAELSQLVGSLRLRLRRVGPHSGLALLEHRLNGAGSPDVVIGVVKELHSTMSQQLEEIRRSEAVARERHQGLVAAKSREIEVLRSQVVEEKRRLAQGRVAVAGQKQRIERGSELAEAREALLQAARTFCAQSEAAYQSRRQARQAEAVALADAQAELAGTQLLALRGAQRGGNVALCSAALEISEEPWRSRAKQACELARGGALGEATDAAEALANDLRAAQQAAEQQKQECQEKAHDAQEEASQAVRAVEAEAGAVDSERSELESRIRDAKEQDAAAQKAEQELASLSAAEHGVLQDIRRAAAAATQLLRRAEAAASQPVAGSLHQALDESSKLDAQAAAFDGALAEGVRLLSTLLAGVRRAAGGALVPLAEQRADAEESALDLKRAGREAARPLRRGPHCDVAALADRSAKFAAFAARVGEASEALAYDLLR